MQNISTENRNISRNINRILPGYYENIQGYKVFKIRPFFKYNCVIFTVTFLCNIFELNGMQQLTLHWWKKILKKSPFRFQYRFPCLYPWILSNGRGEKFAWHSLRIDPQDQWSCLTAGQQSDWITVYFHYENGFRTYSN